MKFLAIAKPTAALGMLPPEVFLQVMEASFANMQQQREDGKLLEFYYSPKGYTVVIFDFDTAEDWVNDRLSTPITNYLDIEAYPLADGMTSMKKMIGSLRDAVK